MQPVIGIDISKKYFDADILGKVKRYDNNSTGFTKMLNDVPTNCHCVMESTGTYGNKLAHALHEAGHIVYIVNPVQVSSFAKMKLSKVKTDKSDAKLITEFAKMNLSDLQPYDFPSESIQSAKQIETLLSELKAQRTSLMNQLEALAQHHYVSEEVESCLKNAIRYFDEEISKLVAKEKHYIDDEHKEKREKIATIPGIGDSTACMLIAVTNCFSSFTSSKQLSSYFGCCPRVRQSGSSVKGRGVLSKQGLSRVRTQLYMCAVSAKKCNASCKALYERLLSKGKAVKVALMAVVNKLIRQIYAIISKNENFVNNYENMFAK